MPRPTSIKKKGFIPLPKVMDKFSYKIEITDSNGATHDVTNDVMQGSGNLNRIATDGLSNFSFNLDNTKGKYKDYFSTGDVVDIYYDYNETVSATIRFRGYIDDVYDNLTPTDGWFISIEGRDSPKSSTNEHFADSKVTLQFSEVNNLDCWLGTTGTADSKGNYPDGVLYNSGMILKVYDTISSSWKVYKDLSAEQKTALKAQTGYTQTHEETYVDYSRLTISKALANEGNYEFRIYYDSDDGNTYLMVHPEEAITNTNEPVSVGQNFLELNRYGKNTREEVNRMKVSGAGDGDILLMRMKQDTARQSATWIKDKQETASRLTTVGEVAAKASARLNELKESPKRGSLSCCCLPTLQPGEKIHFSIPYIVTGDVKVKSFTMTFGGKVLDFSLDLKDRETRFERIIKDQTDETADLTSVDNPNGMGDWYFYDFSNSEDYLLTDCQITNNVLTLESGDSEGTCITINITHDRDVTQGELRIKGNQYQNCDFYASNDGGNTWKAVILKTLFNFSTIGKNITVKIILKPFSGANPEFNSISLGVK